jgi:hypothetical protein
MTYKIIDSGIKIVSTNIPIDPENRDYQQFVQDVAEQGIEIVEGPDIIEPDYATLRQQEYPSREEQFDMQYHDQVNGTTTWRDTIQAIKDKYPNQQEYPSREEQFDMQYHDQVNGTTTWRDTIQAIKDKYPKTITGGTTIGPIPDWVQEAVNA